MFLLLGEVIKYSPSKMLKDASQIHGTILAINLGKFRNDRIEYKCIKNLVKTIIKIIDKTTDYALQTAEVLDVYDTYFSKPNRMGLLVIKNILDELPENSYFSKAKAASIILRERKIVHDILEYLKKEDNDAGFAFDLE